MAERLKAAGAILIGKTNTPEFGAGSQTFNKVFGATRNPYDLSKTCGGSSGGAAVAVACGMVPFADGGDFAASLRNPGNYCNVIGFRPSTGRVPAYPHPYPWSNLSELGPMARTVSDAAFLLSVQAGPDPRAPTSITEPGSIFLKPLKRNFQEDPRRLEPRPRRPAGRARGHRSPGTATKRHSRSWAASSRTPSPTSPARPRPSSRCAR